MRRRSIACTAEPAEHVTVSKVASNVPLFLGGTRAREARPRARGGQKEGKKEKERKKKTWPLCNCRWCRAPTSRVPRARRTRATRATRNARARAHQRRISHCVYVTKVAVHAVSVYITSVQSRRGRPASSTAATGGSIFRRNDFSRARWQRVASSPR